MTTVAWDGRTLVADSAATTDSRKITTHKLFRLADGSLVGGAGTLTEIREMVAWLNSGSDPETLPECSDCDLLLVKTDGSVLEFSGSADGIPVLDKVAAIGSGAEYAIGAMLAGKPARRAVEIAAMRDPFTRGPFVGLRLKRQ